MFRDWAAVWKAPVCERMGNIRDEEFEEEPGRDEGGCGRVALGADAGAGDDCVRSLV